MSVLLKVLASCTDIFLFSFSLFLQHRITRSNILYVKYIVESLPYTCLFSSFYWALRHLPPFSFCQHIPLETSQFRGQFYHHYSHLAFLILCAVPQRRTSLSYLGSKLIPSTSKPHLQQLSLAHLWCQTASRGISRSTDQHYQYSHRSPGRKFPIVLTTAMKRTTKPPSASCLHRVLHSTHARREAPHIDLQPTLFTKCCEVHVSPGWQPGVWFCAPTR